MNQTQAMAALAKLYGKQAAWRRNEKALIGEEREAELAKVPELKAAAETAKAARDARRAELLKDPEYLRLSAAAQAAEAAANKARSCYHVRRVSVGKINGAAGLSFFHIEGQGDNWQEAIDDARAKRNR